MIDEAFGGGREPSDLANAIHAVLDRAGMPQKRLDLIMEEIAEWEDETREPDPDDERDARADYEYERDR
jgi:hypothetical protein